MDNLDLSVALRKRGFVEDYFNINNLNRAVYYWDYFTLTGDEDFLTAAAQFMDAYRRNGGTGYDNVESAIQDAVKSRP